MVGKTVAHYRVTRQIGGGGMGVVFEAEDLDLGRSVALKFLPPDLLHDTVALQRFQREARAASTLNHPNICTIYAIEQHQGQHFIAMELLEGQPLSQRMSKGVFDSEQLLAIAIQVADALGAAHAKGIVHRDVKPANIFLNERGQAKILDFGLAKLEVALAAGASSLDTIGDVRNDLTNPGTAMGTVAYMSPEQARGQATDARTDIFSFGAVLYQMATGILPFQGDTSAVVFEAILNREPMPATLLNPKVPSEFQRIIGKALEKDRALRYQSAHDMKTDLIRLKRDLDSGNRPAAAHPSSGVAAAAAAEKSLAVLYFENLSGAKEDEYFRDGMTEDVITELSKIRTLRVYPRPTVVAFRDKSVTARQIAQQLGANFVLGGSLRRAGNRIRITAQLVDTQTEFPLWSERFDRELQDVFEVQDEIARKIAEALRITLSPQEQKAIEAKPTGNAQAYDFFLRGRSYARRVTRPDLELAIQMYERATEMDAAFASAYAGLAYVYGLFHEWHARGDQQWLEKAKQACDKAVALSPDMPEVLTARARVAYTQNEPAEAIRFAQLAIRQKPDTDGAYWCLGQAYFVTKQFEAAANLATQAAEFAGDDYNCYIPYVNSLTRLERTDEAFALREQQSKVMKRHLEIVPEDVRARILLSSIYALLKDETNAVAEVKTAVALRPNDSNILYNAACTYALLNRKQDALVLLKRSKEAGFLNMQWAANDPDLACLADEPQFKSIIGN